MADARDFQQAADHLADATFAIERADYNVLLDEELRAVLEAKQVLRRACLRLRQDQRATERRAAQTGHSADSDEEVVDLSEVSGEAPCGHIPVEVPVDRATWDDLQQAACTRAEQAGRENRDAVAWSVWNSNVTLEPVPVVDGEPKAVTDLVDE